MAVDDLLRVAWQAQLDGRGPLREAMLTLAVAEGRPTPATPGPSAAAPGSWPIGPATSSGPTRPSEQTLADPQVAEAIRTGSAASTRRAGSAGSGSAPRSRRGPFTGELASLETVVDALARSPGRGGGPPRRRRGMPAAPGEGPGGRPGRL